MPAPSVMRAFFAAGGRMIDSSPMYGSSQDVIGHGLRKLGHPDALFSADKVWISSGARGPAQIETSRARWGVPRFDLLQVHNLLSWEEHLPALLRMKAEGRVRYVGITTSEGRRHRDIERIMAKQPIDFVQVTYNVLDREVEARILPLARERGIAVIVNRPFREGALIRARRAPSPAGLGGGDRLHELGAVRAQVRRLASGRHLRDSGHQQCRARAGEHGRRARHPAGRRDARPHGGLRRGAVMSEWWTYRLSDFLMFSPRTYHRLFELTNAELWPLQIVTIAAGLAVLWLAVLKSTRRGAQRRVVAAVLAAAWIVVAWAYHFERYATINTGAPYYAAGFALEAVLLAWCMLRRDGLRFDPQPAPVRWTSLGLLAAGVVLYPLLAPLLGRPWMRAEIFGVAPDPTAIATVGAASAGERPHRLAAHAAAPVVRDQRADAVDDGSV